MLLYMIFSRLILTLNLKSTKFFFACDKFCFFYHNFNLLIFKFLIYIFLFNFGRNFTLLNPCIYWLKLKLSRAKLFLVFVPITFIFIKSSFLNMFLILIKNYIKYIYKLCLNFRKNMFNYGNFILIILDNIWRTSSTISTSYCSICF